MSGIVESLQQWRNEGQVDNILLHRNSVIALLTEIENARAMCDSYAKETQQFHDEIERLREALRDIASMRAEELYYSDGQEHDNAAAAYAAQALKPS